MAIAIMREGVMKILDAIVVKTYTLLALGYSQNSFFSHSHAQGAHKINFASPCAPFRLHGFASSMR